MQVHRDAKKKAVTASKTFLDRASDRFGNRFDYSSSVYLSAKTKIEIVCPDHGPFWQTPNNHLNSRDGGCSRCRDQKLQEKFSKGDEFIQKAKSVHDRYRYDLVKYTNLVDKVEVVCPDHGSFWQAPANHLKGYGCPSCAGRTVDLKSFINKARSVHGDKYDYTRSVYVSATSPVEIVCRDHGSFWQTPADHCNNQAGCSNCSGIFVFDTGSFLQRIELIRNDQYDYSKVNYIRHDHRVEVICPDHGSFWQTPNTLLNGTSIGCPVCARRDPKWERELSEILTGWGIHHVRHHKEFFDDRREFDIYIPEHGIAIELCGLYWHCHDIKQDSRYHLKKLQVAQAHGVDLLTIFEDEWVHRRETVLRVIQYKLGLSRRGIGARKCQIREIPYGEGKVLLDQYHLQGKSTGIHIGAYHGDELIGVMVFGTPTRQQTRGVELKRFCTDGRNHPGLARRLFSYYIKKYNPATVVSFSDNRWFQGDVYQTLGFELDGVIPPDYSYFLGTNRFHKSGFRKDQIRKKFPDLYNPMQTQNQMMEHTPYRRIFDCGKKRWVWTSPG